MLINKSDVPHVTKMTDSKTNSFKTGHIPGAIVAWNTT